MIVFNMLVSFTTSQLSADWIKSVIHYNDGRQSIKALCAHFSSKGNASRNKADVNRLKDTFHYKNERAINFKTFLTQC